MTMIANLFHLRSVPAACRPMPWGLALCLVVAPAAWGSPATSPRNGGGAWKAKPVALAEADDAPDTAEGDDGRSVAEGSMRPPTANAATKAHDPNKPRHVGVAEEKRALEAIGVKTTIDEILGRTLPPRSDRPGDWEAGLEPLHRCGEPRWIEPCVPPPPCHPALPPHPHDLVGVSGDPTCGPIYAGPCCPRTGSHDDGPAPRVHRLHDRLFDAFYRTK